MRTVEKDPDSFLDYGHRWTRWLNGDSIYHSTFIVPSGLTLVSHSKTSTTATVWLTGGTAGQNYKVVNRITTAAGRKDDRTILVRCVEK